MKKVRTRNKTVINALTIDLLKIDFKSKYLRLSESVKKLKEKKEGLQAAFEEIEDIYNHAPCGYHSLDEKGVFVRINNTELDWLGYTREEFCGIKKFTDILSDQSRKKFVKTFAAFKKSGHIKEVEFEFVRRDGSCFPVLLSATAIYDEAGNYSMSRSVVQDIAHRKQMEQELRDSYNILQQTISLFSLYRKKIGKAS